MLEEELEGQKFSKTLMRGVQNTLPRRVPQEDPNPPAVNTMKPPAVEGSDSPAAASPQQPIREGKSHATTALVIMPRPSKHRHVQESACKSNSQSRGSIPKPTHGHCFGAGAWRRALCLAARIRFAIDAKTQARRPMWFVGKIWASCVREAESYRLPNIMVSIALNAYAEDRLAFEHVIEHLRNTRPKATCKSTSVQCETTLYTCASVLNE